MVSSAGQLRIFFDAYELAPGVGKSIGIYNYAKNLFRALVENLGNSIELTVACNSACAPDFDASHPSVKLQVLRQGAPSTLARQLWLRGGAALAFRRNRSDIYFSPKGFLPNGIRLLSPRAKSAVVVHDLIPLWYAEKHPGHFGQLEQLVVNQGLSHSVRKADCVIAISGATATDIERRLGRSAGVVVVHNGVPVTPPGLPPLSGPYVFAVTSSFPHKNASGVLAAYSAYRQLTDTPIPLVVCGIDDPLLPGVVALKGLSDTAMHGCYANARLVLFLSFVEGFGFPPVEAMTHGTQALCSDIPSLREVTRGAAFYAPPDDPQKVGRKLHELLAQPAPDRKATAAAVAGFSWDACARGILDVFGMLSKEVEKR